MNVSLPVLSLSFNSGSLGRTVGPPGASPSFSLVAVVELHSTDLAGSGSACSQSLIVDVLVPCV